MSKTFTIKAYGENETFLYEQNVDEPGLRRVLSKDAGYPERQVDVEVQSIYQHGSALLASRDAKRGYDIEMIDDAFAAGNPIPMPYADMPATFTLPCGRMITQVELLAAATASYADAFGIEPQNLAAEWNADSDHARRTACQIAIEAIAYTTEAEPMQRRVNATTTEGA
jgi:hypothetical protein